MFNQQEFVKFLDDYKRKLVETDNLLEESKENYRVKKLAIFYGLRDKETFNYFLSSKLGRRYLGIAKYVLTEIQNHKVYGSSEIKEVANSLLAKYFSTSYIEPVFDNDLLEGYFKFLCDFTRKDKFEQLKEEVGNVELNLSNLEFVS
ncbi:hypothetical protein MWH28_02770 [Natroniella sulfidigena]|uniref:hypothetical protein n=1 Tax=Natroniella sulfidigena TaxID=723921 RepID=UPI00200A632B|nr:hypothetical protein [Natroniella sulfidigena]MCK8816285.1 hypothetical protein [Natroniella sulfidigena]